MIAPLLPFNESARLSALSRMGFIGFERDERCQRYARVAQAALSAPIAAVSIVGAADQWFRGCVGVDSEGSSRAVSFCGHTLHEPDVFEVPDTHLDARFADNPLVTGAPHIRFYAGCALRLPGELAAGALCVIDTVPRQLDARQRRLLVDLAGCLQSELATLLSVADMHDVARELFTQLPGRAGG